MAEPTSLPSPDENDTLVSPLPHTSSFPHTTSADVVTRMPFIDTATPAINPAPVELDGIPTSPDVAKQSEPSSDSQSKRLVSPGLGEEEDINEEFLGEGERGVGREVREKRAAMLASRSKDPSVIVDVPNDPTAEEVEAAKSADGTTTPAVRDGEIKP